MYIFFYSTKGFFNLTSIFEEIRPLRISLLLAQEMEPQRTLVLDLGNTRTKWALFENESLEEAGSFSNSSPLNQKELNNLKSFQAEILIYSSVLGKDYPGLNNFQSISKNVREFTTATAVGIASNYKTPATLGADRWANAAAARSMFDDRNVCVFDIGTCLKHDVVTADGVYLGGSISPGVSMRFKALTNQTNQLPLTNPAKDWPSSGNDTESSIRAGVMEGLLLEIKGRITSIKQQFKQPIFVLTGGDAHYFADKLKNSTFAVPNLTLIGIHTAVKYHGK